MSKRVCGSASVSCKSPKVQSGRDESDNIEKRFDMKKLRSRSLRKKNGGNEVADFKVQNVYLDRYDRHVLFCFILLLLLLLNYF
jgi:hypothetical protein